MYLYESKEASRNCTDPTHDCISNHITDGSYPQQKMCQQKRKKYFKTGTIKDSFKLLSVEEIKIKKTKHKNGH